MTTIAEGLSAVSTALGIVKTLRDIDRSVQEAEFKLQIATATSALADAKIALVDAQEETKKQQEEIARLQAAVRHRDEQTVLVAGFRFRSVDGCAVGRAYCPVCIDEGRYLHQPSFSMSEMQRQFWMERSPIRGTERLGQTSPGHFDREAV